VFGCGFTEDLRFSDYHVGFFNTILQFGAVGFLFFLYFFAYYYYLIKMTLVKLGKKNPFRIPINVLAISLGGILLAYFTTFHFFPMDNDLRRPFFIGIFISLTEFFIRESNKYEDAS
jgi:hypothetical protein